MNDDLVLDGKSDLGKFKLTSKRSAERQKNWDQKQLSIEYCIRSLFCSIVEESLGFRVGSQFLMVIIVIIELQL